MFAYLDEIGVGEGAGSTAQAGCRIRVERDVHVSGLLQLSEYVIIYL